MSLSTCNKLIDDSPVAMDISETTNTSQESPESQEHDAIETAICGVIEELNILDNNDALPSHALLGLSNKNMTITGSRYCSVLTSVNCHPLMSPPATDSDSESGPPRSGYFSYPDIVPENGLKSSPTRKSTTAKPSRRNSNENENIDNLSTNARRKITILREPSPVLQSSESEPDLSQYQAAVNQSFQSVALISNNTKSRRPPSPLYVKRKISISGELLSDDLSSLDTLSNRSLDDLDENLVSISPDSSLNDLHDSGKGNSAPKAMAEPLPLYTAMDETKDARSWQKVTLPDGRTREIDMKVIDPYKRVFSHGGYLKAGGHNAIVIFSACHLPDRSRKDYHYVMDNLFLYVVKTLEQLVTEDYVLIYLHGGSNRSKVPPFPWLRKCYHLLDRRLRKSLKNLFMVHPTFWLKSIVWMSRPFISSKFWRKLVYVQSLDELYTLVPVERAAVPDKVKAYDAKHT